ncbi:hypothetical protein ES708_24408 [subsurface metagenome]
MGQRQDQTEIVYGNDCLLKFDAGTTPKYMFARFSQLVRCPGAVAIPPNDRAFKLTQVPGVDCMWDYDIDPWYISLEFVAFPLATELRILHRPSADMYFFDSVAEYVDEGYVFTNEFGVCGLQVGAVGGTGVVTWRLETIALMKALNIEPAYDLFMEMRPLVDGNKVYKYCRLKDGTNIAIEFESD